MGSTFALAFLMWLATGGYAVLDAGLSLVGHCSISPLGALLGRAAKCASATPDLGTVAGGGDPTAGGGDGNKFAQAFAAAMMQHYPRLRYAGSYNCRHMRGSGSDPSCWSEHAWGNAVDFWPPSGPGHPTDPYLLAAKAWANRPDVMARYNVNDAWIDTQPGDLHVQFNPAHPCGSVPPCAGGPQTKEPASAGLALVDRLMLGVPRAPARTVPGRPLPKPAPAKLAERPAYRRAKKKRPRMHRSITPKPPRHRREQ